MHSTNVSNGNTIIVRTEKKKSVQELVPGSLHLLDTETPRFSARIRCFFVCPLCLLFTHSSDLCGPLTSVHLSTSHSYFS